MKPASNSNYVGIILLIEDDFVQRKSIREVLEAAGYQVTECADGDEGIARFHENLPDLVITNIVMEGKDGIGVLVEVRNQAPQVPVIVISGTEEFLISARRLGATHTLFKPFRMQELFTCIEDSMAG